MAPVNWGSKSEVGGGKVEMVLGKGTVSVSTTVGDSVRLDSVLSDEGVRAEETGVSAVTRVRSLKLEGWGGC